MEAVVLAEVTFGRPPDEEGQLFPSAVQTAEPFTLIDEAFSVVPLAVAKPNQPVEVALVNTPVEGVVAPMDELFTVPPLMVRISATLASVSVPVMEPNEPKARVTPELPRVPELMAVAFTLPVESMVKPFTTIASVTELEGRLKLPVTARLVDVVLVPVALVQINLERLN